MTQKIFVTIKELSLVRGLKNYKESISPMLPGRAFHMEGATYLKACRPYRFLLESIGLGTAILPPFNRPLYPRILLSAPPSVDPIIITVNDSQLAHVLCLEAWASPCLPLSDRVQQFCTRWLHAFSLHVFHGSITNKTGLLSP